MLGWLRNRGREARRQGSDASAVVGNADPFRDAAAGKAEGDAFLQSGDLAEAIRSYGRALELDPHLAGVHTPLAFALRGQGRLDDAAVAISTALSHEGAGADAHYLAALIFRERGDAAAAIMQYRRVLELDPGAAEACRDLALLLVQGGRTSDAELVLGQGIARHPEFADLHAYRGNLHLHEKHFASAVESYDRALALHPDYPEVHYNRALALHALARLDEALQSCEAALRARPDYLAALLTAGELLRLLHRPEESLALYDRAVALDARPATVHLSRGNMLLVLHRPAEALQSFEQALRLDPRLAAALHNQGGALRELGRHAEALESYDRALAMQPDMLAALIDKGATLRALERPADALACYQLALARDPDLPDVLNNAALAQLALKRPEEALASCARALELRPDFAEALNNRGLILQDLNRPAEALAAYDRALQLQERMADAHANRANLLQELVRHEEALGGYERALQIDPGLERTFLNQSLAQLVTGRLPLGWQKYEWRWPGKQKREPIREFEQPLWLGHESVRGKSVLLYAEQGLGDTIQFCRYAQCVAELGAAVELEVQAPLKSLLGGLAGVKRVFARGEEMPEFDLHAPLLSMPLAFGTAVESIPHPGPYLNIEAQHSERVRAWDARMGARSRPRIGLVWSGNPNHGRDSERSIPLARFERMLSVEDAEFVCLQNEVRDSDAAVLKQHPQIRSFNADLIDFVETAALVSQLDLVVCVDTSVAHLAGAMGRATWLLVTAHPDWRWLLQREDSPWYSTVRLFRQPHPGDWDDVLARVEQQLRAFVATWSPPGGRTP